jgi:NAD(P)H-nitrite reductase large subunit
VVDPLDGPLAALLPQQAGAQLRDALSELNVTWHFGAKVKAVDRFADGADMRLRISLSDGTQVHTDQILSAIGLKANMSLAQAAGLACERGILVGSFLQTSAANVWHERKGESGRITGQCGGQSLGGIHDRHHIRQRPATGNLFAGTPPISGCVLRTIPKCIEYP